MIKLTREQIIGMVTKIKSGCLNNKELDRALAELKNGVTDPYITDYIFFEELTPEEIADKALSYKPILL